MKKLILFVLLIGVVSLVADDRDLDRATLKGVREFRVSVADPGPELSKVSFSAGELRAETEMRLREKGLHVVDDPTAPVLFVSITTVKGGLLGTYAYNVEVSFIQPVTLARNPSIGTSVATWSVEQIGQTKKLHEIRDDLSKQVDRFANAWLAANAR